MRREPSYQKILIERTIDRESLLENENPKKNHINILRFLKK